MIVSDPTIRKFLKSAASGVLIVLGLFLLFGLVYPCGQIMAAEETMEVIAGVPANFPPEYQVDAHGEPYGFAVDLFEAVSRLSGIRVRYVVYDGFPLAISALKNGEVDLIPVLGVIEERQVFTDFTIPIVTFNIRIFIRDTTTDIGAIEDLAGRHVAVVAENQGYFIMQTHPEVELIVFQSMEEALFALISGSVDAMVYPDVPLLGIARQSGIETRITAVGEPFAEIKRAIGVRKGQPELVAKLDDTLQTFIQTPDYQQLLAQWYGAPQPFWNTERVLIVVGIALAFAGLLFFAIHYRATLQLNQKLAKSLAETERSRQELARWGQIFANAQWGVAVTSPDGETLTLINPAFASMHGTTPEDMSGSPLTEFYAPEVRPTWKEHLRMVEEKGHHTFESLHRRKDGTSFPARVDITLVTDENGETQYHVVNCQDISEQVQADTELFISLEKFRVLFDTFPLGITVTDPEGQIIEANRESERLLGISRQEQLARTYDGLEWRIVGRDGSPMLAEEFASVRALQENHLVENVEMGIVKASGEITWITVTAAPLPLPDYGVVVAYGDITERIQAEEALREKSEEIEQYFAVSLDLFCIADVQGYFRRLNPQWEQTLGYPLAELENHRFLDLVHPDDLTAAQEALVGLSQQRVLLNFVNRFRHRDGSYRWIEWRSYPRGNLIYAAARDITERKMAEQELAASEARYRAFFENSMDAMLLTNAEGKILEANPAACQMFDQTEDEIIQGGRDGLLDTSDSRLVHLLEERIRVGKAGGELTMIRRDGKPFPSDITSALFRGQEGDLYASVIVRDITERKRVEEEIRRKATNLTILLETSQTFISTANLELVFQATVDNLVALTDLDSAAIYLLTENQLFLGATTPPLPPDFPEDYRDVPIEDHPHIQQTLTVGKPVIIPDAREAVLSQGEQKLVEMRDLRSILYIPICMEEKVSGVLIVASCGRVKEISVEEIDLCTMLANLSAVAIANARSFQALNERGEQLRALTVRLAEVEEAERSRLARELHDRVGQSLTALNLNLNILRAEISPESSTDIDNRLRDSLELVGDTMAQTRNVIDELRPSLLEDFGLVAALQDHCDAIARRAQIAIHVRGSERRYPLDAALENTFFRVAQEAINNVLKHAGASRIDIRVNFQDPILRMEIEDDGAGFDVDDSTDLDRQRGWGLITMRERLEALGGRLWIESRPGQGTRLLAEVAV